MLSVDDDMVNQAVIDMLLKPDGYDIVKAMSGDAALQHLHACTTFPDLILLDVMMPGMSGYEVCPIPYYRSTQGLFICWI